MNLGFLFAKLYLLVDLKNKEIHQNRPRNKGNHYS